VRLHAHQPQGPLRSGLFNASELELLEAILSARAHSHSPAMQDRPAPMMTTKLVLPALPADKEAAQRILDWVRKGRRTTFSRQQVGGLHLPRTREALDDLEIYGYIRFNTTLKRYQVGPRAFEGAD